VVATAKDAILMWNIEGMFPQTLSQPFGRFIGAHTILFSSGLASDWDFWDITANTHNKITPKVDGMPTSAEVSADGRLLSIIMTPQGPNALVVYPDLKKQIAIEGIGNGFIGLVAGDALVYSTGKARVFGKVGDQEARELVVMQGDVQSLAACGPLGYAALAKSGDLVRGTFAGGVARLQIKDLTPDAFVACDATRNVLVASGNRLLRWRGGPKTEEAAQFVEKITAVNATDAGTYVVLANRDLFFLSPRGAQTRVPISEAYDIVDHGRRVVGLAAGMQIEIVDMPSLAKWTLPKLYNGRAALSASTDGRYLLHGYGGVSMLWTLPATLPPLNQLTNAKDDDGAISWPWQP
jgi:hypothetical protein